MGRRQKLQTKLEFEDAELRKILVSSLEEVAAGRNTGLFVTQHNNPWPELGEGSQLGNQIVERATKIIVLAQQLREDPSKLVATKVLASFEGANDLKNENRLGPIRRAQELLAAISSSTDR